MSLLRSRFRDRFHYERLDKNERSFAKRQFKIAILGTEQSGRKEIMHQIRCICKTYSELQRLIFKESISNKVLDSLLNILEGMDKNGVRFTVQRTEDLADAFKARSSECRGHISLQKWTVTMLLLWNDENLQKYFKEGILDKPCEYFLNSLRKISSKNYLPTDEDINIFLNPDDSIYGDDSNRLIDSIEETYKDIPRKFIAIDVTNMFEPECIHEINQCNYIVFFVSLTDYDLLIGDNKLNAIDIAIASISQLLSIEAFDYHIFGLFFTNIDLFEEKLKTIQLKHYFPLYKGENNIEEAYEFIFNMFSNHPIIKDKIKRYSFYRNTLDINDQVDIREELFSNKVPQIICENLLY